MVDDSGTRFPAPNFKKTHSIPIPYLVDDSGTRFPEPNSILGSCSSQEVIDLLVDGLGLLQVLGGSNLRLYEVVTVDGRRNCYLHQTVTHRTIHK